MISAADTAFVLAAAGLVLLMTPGLALFYAGYPHISTAWKAATVGKAFLCWADISEETVL
jgi:Amt family ammonium transporter